MMERDLEGWDDAAWERMRGAVDEVTDEPAGPDAVRLGVLLSDAEATRLTAGTRRQSAP